MRQLPYVNTHSAGLSGDKIFHRGSLSLVFIQVLCIVLFGATCKVDFVEAGFTNTFVFSTGIVVMLFLGFGYLMTLLKRFGMGAVGFTMMLTAIAIQWGLLCENFFSQLYHLDSESWKYISVNGETIRDAAHLTTAILVSMGAVVGKASPLQLVVMTFFECIFYAINKRMLCMGVVDSVDAGGSIFIFMFGAYFGLAASFVLGKPEVDLEAEGGHVSDIFSLVGTVLLWVYWPAFNAAAMLHDSAGQQRAVINTLIAMTFSAIASFIASVMFSGSTKFRPIDIQNATIAGGIAMGAVAKLTLNPADPALIGCAAGLLCTLGFAKIQPFLESKCNIHDTCGVHNLHGLPGLLGGVCSVILAAIKVNGLRHDYPEPYSNSSQAGHQMVAIVFTFAIATLSGLISGYFMYLFHSDGLVEPFSDAPYWEVMDDFGRSMVESGQLEMRLGQSLAELNASVASVQKLQQVMKLYSETGATNEDEDDDAYSDDIEMVGYNQPHSNLVPVSHAASTMFGSSKNNSLSSSRHGSGPSLQASSSLNSSRHGSSGGLNSSRHGSSGGSSSGLPPLVAKNPPPSSLNSSRHGSSGGSSSGLPPLVAKNPPPSSLNSSRHGGGSSSGGVLPPLVASKASTGLNSSRHGGSKSPGGLPPLVAKNPGPNSLNSSQHGGGGGGVAVSSGIVPALTFRAPPTNALNASKHGSSSRETSDPLNSSRHDKSGPARPAPAAPEVKQKKFLSLNSSIHYSKLKNSGALLPGAPVASGVVPPLATVRNTNAGGLNSSRHGGSREVRDPLSSSRHDKSIPPAAVATSPAADAAERRQKKLLTLNSSIHHSKLRLQKQQGGSA